MLIDFLTNLASTTVPAARKAGLVSEVAGIAGRYSRHKKAWQPHLSTTKTVIEKALTQADPDRPVLVLGAGLCLDIPLSALNQHPAGAVLMDAVYTPRARYNILKYNNIHFEYQDITGFLKPFWNSAEGDEVTIPTIAPIPQTGYSLIISCNVLSQVQLPFAASPPANDIERRITAKLQQSHIKALKSTDCQALVITDFERIEATAEGEETIPTLAPTLLATPDVAWLWHIAPEGEVRPGLDVKLSVGSWVLTK